MTNKSQATVLAAKGILIGFTALGTVFGWAQLSATSLASGTDATARANPSGQSSATNSAPSGTTLNPTSNLRTARAPSPFTRTRSSR